MYSAMKLFVGISLCVVSLVAGRKVPELPAIDKANQYLRNAYPYWEPLPVKGEVGPRLILTDLIESGDVEGARALAKVSGGPFPDNIPSYSGFFTVNSEYNSNLYFWFFPAETNYENAPVLLWLQGGPGSSSLFALFTELGPFTVAFDDETLIENPYSWHKNHSIIFIDNPVGTGFSFTDDDAGYATSQTQVGADLYTAMIQFFKMFPELKANEFFVTGESFAGKYVPALGYTIHKNNPTADLKINLQGIVVGNGFTDPITIFEYSKFVFQLGLVDVKTRDRMSAVEEEARQAILSEQYVLAWNKWNQDLNLWNSNSEYSNNYNFLYVDEPVYTGDYAKFVQSAEVRELLHVGDTEYSNGGIVYNKMIPEFMISVRPWLEVLIENYRVLYYNGQMDVIVAYPLSVNMYQTLQFSATDEYLNAKRRSWKVNGEIAGYAKSAGNFTEMLVRNAGHMVPTDQPVWAFDLINRFTSNNMP